MADRGPVLDVQDLRVRYPLRRGRGKRASFVRAVDGVSLRVSAGETLGLVGESGSGKSSIGSAVLRHAPIHSGTVRFAGRDVTNIGGAALRSLRRRMQMVFQDPYSSLNSRMTVEEIVAEPLLIHGEARTLEAARPRVMELLRSTGLPESSAYRHPHAFSGGQRQRIGIARALALTPDLLILDEPVASLDTSMQSQVVNLLQDLQERQGLAYVFIAHDLSVVRHISDRVAILYAGKIMEQGDCASVYSKTLHPYTRALLSAVPVPDPTVEQQRQRVRLEGEPATVTDEAAGCVFQTRCTEKVDRRCREEVPELREIEPGHLVACHHVAVPVEISTGRRQDEINGG